jgi:hypothetical protein
VVEVKGEGGVVGLVRAVGLSDIREGCSCKDFENQIL